MPLQDPYRQRLIRQIVKIYKNQYSEEYAAVVRACEELRQTRANAYAADSLSVRDAGDAMRFILRVPKRLTAMVDGFLRKDQEPSFLGDQAEVIWFAKEFPEFKIAEKI